MVCMDIGIAMPAIASRDFVLDWARRADSAPFASLALLDRIVYDNPEPLVTLAVLAGATERIRLQTEVLLAPIRETPLLAKQAATFDRLSGGRFTLGLGIGGREDDYAAAGFDVHTRGRRFDAQMEQLRALWSGEPAADDVGPIGPAPLPGGPEVLFGAFAPAGLARVAKYGDGLLSAGPPSWTGPMYDTVREQWQAAGRAGQPRFVAQANAALGEAGATEARANISRYYGPELGPRMAASMLDQPEQILDAIGAFEKLGADEVILYDWCSDPRQVTEIAAVIGS